MNEQTNIGGGLEKVKLIHTKTRILKNEERRKKNPKILSAVLFLCLSADKKVQQDHHNSLRKIKGE